MAGRMIEIEDRNEHTFNQPVSTSLGVVLGKRAYFTPDFTSGVLVVVFHAKSLASSTATLDIKVENTFFAPDNPTVLFAPAGGQSIATVSIANADAAGQVYQQIITAPIGPYLRVRMNHSQGANGGICVWTTSVYILGRDS